MLSFLIVVALFILGASGYLAYVIFSGWAEVKAAPREEMLMCDKHGPIRQNGTIDFFGSRFCGLCFHEKLSAAERGIVK